MQLYNVTDLNLDDAKKTASECKNKVIISNLIKKKMKSKKYLVK